MIMKKPTYTIAVTGLNAIDSPGPGVPVIRALHQARAFNVRVIGLCYEHLEPGIYMKDLVHKIYHVPYPSMGRAALMERLEYIHTREKFQVLIPNFDAELFNYIRLQSQLEQQLGVKMVLPTQEQFEARHKANLSKYGEKHGINVPTAIQVNTVKDAIAVAENWGYPVVIKGKFYDAKIAYTAAEVSQFFCKIAGEWGLPLLIQQFVKGVEVNVCGLGDGLGNTIGAVPMKKLYITDKGKAWAGVTLDDGKLIEMTHHLVAATRWRGPFELELIKTNNDEYYLIEINPRLPAWCYLPIGAGQNQAESLIKLALDEPVEPFQHYEVGKMFIRYAYDLIVDMEEFQAVAMNGEL